MSKSKINICFKTLKLIIFTGLFVFACFFTINEWKVYTQKITSIKIYQEPVSSAPINVLCFNPFAKTTVINKYELTLDQFFMNLPNLNLSLTEFYNEVYYQIGRDFKLSFADKTFLNLEEGVNTIGVENETIIVEKVLTIFTGLCYKISANFLFTTNSTFILEFNNSLDASDVSLGEIYLTSEDNADGIIDLSWANGKEVKFSIRDSVHVFKLEAVKTKFLAETSDCLEDNYNECIMEKVNNTGSSVANS